LINSNRLLTTRQNGDILITGGLDGDIVQDVPQVLQDGQDGKG